MSEFSKDTYVVAGCRTPFLKATGKSGPFSASDLAVMAGRSLFLKQGLDPGCVGEVIVGCVMPSEEETNIGRVVSLRLGCGHSVPAWTVQRNCASSMQALDSAAKDIASGRHDLVLAGGTEAMSRAPLLFNTAMADWFSAWAQARSPLKKARMIAKLRPSFFVPTVALIKGLTDFTVGLGMGHTAENLAARFNITREQMDEFAVMSHERLKNAQDSGVFNDEIVPLFDTKGQVYTTDEGLRRDSSIEKLAKLKPAFDRKYGRVTAANSSQITDGAVMMLLAGETALKTHKLKPIARIRDVQWAGLDPAVMGLGPVFAATPLMQRNNLTFDDIDYWEINEAFATQVQACLAAWKSDSFCHEHFGLQKALGELSLDKLNVDGGAVALGHPVGASGARIVLHLINVLKRNNAKRGIATICVGGGQGGAMLIEML